MTSTSLDSESRWALLWQPDGRQMRLRASIDTDRVRGLTGRETRRALASTLRLGLDYSVTISAAVYAQQRENSDTSLGERPVQVPLWPSMFHDGETSTLSTRWWLEAAFGDYGESTGAAWTTSEPTPSSPDWAVPTMRGYLAKPIEWDLFDPRWVRGDIQFDESGSDAEAVVIPEETWVAGPTVDGETTYLFPLDLLDLRERWSPRRNAVSIEFNERIGFGRDNARHVYPQLASRAPEYSLTLQGAAGVSKLLRWFQDHSGSVRAFWLPVWSQELALASSTSSGSADVTLVNASLLGSLRRIAFVAADGTVITRKVVSIASNTLTLDSSPGTLAAASTMVLTLALVRFASDQLTVDCRQMPKWATTTLAFEEVREEVAAPSGETSGTTLGAVPAVAYLYEFSVGSETVYFTSHESDIVEGALAFTAESTDETVAGTLLIPVPQADGEIVVTITGGAAPYTVSVTGQSDQTGSGPTFTFSGLSVGDYTVTVTDDDGATDTDTVHVYLEAHETGLVEASNVFNLFPLDTTQSNDIPGIAKFDGSLGTLLGVTFGYTDGVTTSFVSFDPDIITTNTAGSSRTIRTEYAQTADLMWDGGSLEAFSHSKNSTNVIAGGGSAAPNNTSSYTIPSGGTTEVTDSASLLAVTGTGDVTGLSIDSVAPTVNLVVTLGSPTPTPTYVYSANRPQIFGTVYVLYRYQVPRA